MSDVKREFPKDRLRSLAEREGLKTSAGRIECPVCRNGDQRGASIGEKDGAGLYHCKRGEHSGSAIDLVMATRGLSYADAVRVLEEISGTLPASPPPAAEGAQVDGAALWRAMAASDKEGQEYLTARALEGSPLFRFNVGGHGVKGCRDRKCSHPGCKLDRWAWAGYRLAVALQGPAGPQSFQVRSVRPPKGDIPTKLSCPDLLTTGLVFGDVAAARAADVVYLAEGMGDTATVALRGVALGAPGSDQVKYLLDALGDVRLRTVVLCPQNDTGHTKARKKSEDAFDELGAELERRKAFVQLLKTPSEHKDPNEWLQADREGFLEAEPVEWRAQAQVLSLLPPGAPGSPMPLPLTKSYASLCEVLRTPALAAKVLEGRSLEYNLLGLAPTLDRRPMKDSDFSRIREQIERRVPAYDMAPLKFSLTDVRESVQQVASERPFHPVRAYLLGLKWDGVRRLDSAAEDSFGLATPLQARCLRLWFVSAVARGMDPGCKVDTVLILQGPQGLLKSTFFSALVPSPELFADTAQDLTGKDALLALASVWIYEWAELEAMQRARDQNAVKSFISSPSDLLRLPYGYSMVRNPRSCVIVGTTNDDAFLMDPTGNRRYWPITCLTVNLDYLRGARDQLWAEALQVYQGAAGCADCAPPFARCPLHRWWLDRSEDEALTASQEEFLHRDAWEEEVARYLTSAAALARRPQGLTVADVLGEGLKKPAGQWSRPDEMRAAAVLKRLGWVKRREMVEGVQGYRWRPKG